MLFFFLFFVVVFFFFFFFLGGGEGGCVSFESWYTDQLSACRLLHCPSWKVRELQLIRYTSLILKWTFPLLNMNKTIFKCEILVRKKQNKNKKTENRVMPNSLLKGRSHSYLQSFYRLIPV